MKISQRDQWDANFTRLYTTSWDYLFYLAQGRPECSSCPVCSCALLFAQIARETAGAASTRSSLRPQSSGGQTKMQTSGDQRREKAKSYPLVIASEAKQSIVTSCTERWIASLRSQ